MTEKQQLYCEYYYEGFKLAYSGLPKPKIDPESRFETESMQDGWDDGFSITTVEPDRAEERPAG